MVSSVPPGIDAVRAQFPALRSGFAYLENAGGSQVPGCVIEAIACFMRESYVQTSAGYPASDRATATAMEAHEFCELLMGAEGRGKVALGGSTTQLCHNLAACYARLLDPGDEVVVSVANHEANAGPWTMLERCGVQVRWWGVDPESGASSLETLDGLLTDRTRIVAFPHTSNLLGDLADVPEIARRAHAAGARVVVDGVAFASHGFMDVAGWDVDFYLYSTYKVYGPHMAALYGRADAWAELEGSNHFFVGRDDVPRKFELGCLPYESCAGVVALGEYLRWLSGRDSLDRETVRLATARMRELEAPLTDRILGYLESKPGVRVVGPGREGRVPTVSFVSRRTPSPEIAEHVNRRGVGIRHGHMYSYRLCAALGVPTDTGFVRVSAVHYNTVEEVDRLIAALDEAL